MVLAVGFLIWKTGSARVWKDNAEGLKESRDELQRKLDELLSEHKEALKTVGEQKGLIQRLEALPNLQKVIEFMSKERERMDTEWGMRTKMIADQIVNGIADLIEQHEREASERHLAVIEQLRRSWGGPTGTK